MSCLTKIYTVCPLVLEFSIKISWTRFSFLEILQKINFVVCFLVLKGFKCVSTCRHLPGRVAQSVGHLTRKSEVLGLIPGLATYFHFSFS